jgi:hypothetical protein
MFQVNYMAAEMLIADSMAGEPTSVDAMSHKAEAEALQRAHEQQLASAKRKFVAGGTLGTDNVQEGDSKRSKIQDVEPVRTYVNSYALLKHDVQGANAEEIDIDDVQAEDEDTGYQEVGGTQRP